MTGSLLVITSLNLFHLCLSLLQRKVMNAFKMVPINIECTLQIMKAYKKIIEQKIVRMFTNEGRLIWNPAYYLIDKATMHK